MSWSICSPSTWFSGHEGSDVTGSMTAASGASARAAASPAECAKMQAARNITWHQSTPGTTSPQSMGTPVPTSRDWSGEPRNESPGSEAASMAATPARGGTRRRRDGSHIVSGGEARMPSPRPQLLVTVGRGPAKRQRCTPDGALVLHRAIGSGSGGKVYLAYEASSSPRRWYAVKKAQHRNSSWLRNEAYVLTTVLPPHKHVVSVPQHLPPTVCDSTGDVFLPMEYAPDGDLLTVVLDAEEMGMGMMPLQVAEVGRQLAEALHHCHANGVFHRDIKPDNVLVHKAAGCVRLADFGSATTERFPKDCCTTSGFAAPEALRCSTAASSAESTPSAGPAPYDAAAADVWSLAISLFCTLYARHPWTVATEEDTFYCDWVATGKFCPRILEQCVASPGTPDGAALPRLLKLFASMLAVNPAARPTMAEVASTLAAITRGEEVSELSGGASVAAESEPKSESPQLRAAHRAPPLGSFSLSDPGCHPQQQQQPAHYRATPRVRECDLDDDISFGGVEVSLSLDGYGADGNAESRLDGDATHDDADMATVSSVSDGSAAYS